MGKKHKVTGCVKIYYDGVEVELEDNGDDFREQVEEALKDSATWSSIDQDCEVVEAYVDGVSLDDFMGKLKNSDPNE